MFDKLVHFIEHPLPIVPIEGLVSTDIVVQELEVKHGQLRDEDIEILVRLNQDQVGSGAQQQDVNGQPPREDTVHDVAVDGAHYNLGLQGRLRVDMLVLILNLASHFRLQDRGH